MDDLVAALARLNKGTPSMEEAHLVLLEQVEDAVVVLLDHGVLAGQHLEHVDAEVLQADSVLSEMVTRLLKRFERDGLVALSRERITVLDAAGLRAV